MRFKRHHHLSCDLLHFLSFSRASHCKRPLVFYARHPFSFTLKCTSLFANFALFRLFCPSSFRIISTVSLSNEMDFEEILTKIGEFGLYQRKLFLFILLPYSFLSAWFHILPYFMISAPDHWCHVASLQHLPQTVQSKLIRPLEPDSSGQMNPSRCRMYDLDYQHLFATSGFINESAATAVFSSHRTNRTRPCSDGWQYDLSEFDETLVTHTNLVCNRSHLIGNVMSVGGFGALLGTPLFGALSDRIGRKKTLLWLNIIFLLSTFSPTFLQDYYAYLISRFLLALVANAMFQIPFILTIELVGPKYRARIGTTANVVWGIGMAIVPGIAYLLRHWLYLNYVVTFAGVIFILLYFLVPESPRWLIARKQYYDANIILKEIATQNNTPNEITASIVYTKKLSLIGRRISIAKQIEPDQGRVRVLFTNWKIFRLFFAITFGYVASSMAYNGLHLNTLTVSGNQFMNFFLLTVIEIPACLTAFVLMETRLGRRWTCSLSLILCGGCLLMTALEQHDRFHTVLWSVVGKCLIALAFNALYQLAVELYPTPLRNQGLSWSATLSNLQSIVLPQLVTIGSNSTSDNQRPIMLIGIICIASGVILTFVPETLNENLPQSIEDAECFADNRSYWSFAKSK